MAVLPQLKHLATEGLLITVAILSVPFFLLFPLLFLPFYLYRSALQLLAPYFNPKAVKMMSLRNSVVSFDNWHTKPEQNILITIGFNADLHFNDIVTENMGKMIERRNEKGEAIYPEFKRYYSSWGGYLFWKEDPFFKLSNHIKSYNAMENKEGTTVGYEEVKKYCLDVVGKPFEKERSPWELIFVNNFKDEEYYPGVSGSVLILRLHHGLCDGFSILEFYISGVKQWGRTKEKLPSAVWSSGAVQPSWKQYLGMALTLPYNALKQGPGSFDVNAFRIRDSKLTKKLRTAQIKFRLDFVKGLSKKWDVTFSGLVFGAIAGGFRKFMLESEMRVPDFIHIGMPFPWPGRGDRGKLQNRMCVCVLKFPVGVTQMEERIKMADSLWKDLKRSPAPLMNWTFMPVFGLLPGVLIKTFVRNDFTTAVLSNFPGPQEPVEVFGSFTEDVEFVTGLWRGNCGVGIGLISVNGRVKINIGIDEAVLQQKQLEALKNHIEKEFQALSDYTV